LARDREANPMSRKLPGHEWMDMVLVVLAPCPGVDETVLQQHALATYLLGTYVGIRSFIRIVTGYNTEFRKVTTRLLNPTEGVA